ncbi:MAG: short-chain dehydrogenase [Deltaproteobacteria bacterium]|nr:MAG: short-chain dehydrogenase [Deltaproteobacteria bacterium]
MNRFSLENKIALITGASRGIGEAIASCLSEAGAKVLLVSRKIDGLKAVEEKIVSNGGQAESLACNMGNMEQIKELVAQVKEKYGKLDILVNNAAANPFFGNMIDAEEWAWDKIFDVNLKGPFFTIVEFAKLMRDNGGGSIVNVSSVNGIRPAPFQGIYSVSKAALIALTKAFAKELAPYKIRVNALLPGLTDTKFASALTSDENLKNMIVSQIPAGRVADPDDMAGAVLYLVSDAASYTTGSLLVCDGGMIA